MLRVFLSFLLAPAKLASANRFVNELMKEEGLNPETKTLLEKLQEVKGLIDKLKSERDDYKSTIEEAIKIVDEIIAKLK